MPPRVPSADAQSPEQIATLIADFLAGNPHAAVLEDGKVAFDLRTAKHTLSTEHNRCTLHLWSADRNLVRRIVRATPRGNTLRLDTERMGQQQTKLLELIATNERRTPTSRDKARTSYLRTLERVLTRAFPDFKPEGFRAAMDLERSFGPAYTRGSLMRSNHAWAIIGVGEHESATTIDSILTLGILWLDYCREHAAGKRLYQGLRIIVPQGTAMLTLSRLAWMNNNAAQWELYELDTRSEELTQRDAADQGNLRTRLVHHPDETAAAERFADAIEQIMSLVPDSSHGLVDQRLRSTSELAFLLHGLEFARATIGLAPNSFAHALELTVGVGKHETLLNESNREALAEHIAELFERRRAHVPATDFGRRGAALTRRISGGSASTAAHSRLNFGTHKRTRGPSPTQDPLYRAAPERWLESALRRDLAPLTRGLAPDTQHTRITSHDQHDNIGNRADDASSPHNTPSKTIPRLNPAHVYTQVPAIAGASDRGMLDLLGVTADGRLAVIELKASDDLHFALQGLDYWIRVRHHHRAAPDAATGMGEFQRHGYFRTVELSPLPPRLYLVAPALHIHPATEIVLRYLSREVEWQLLAIDERWRQQVRVVWRRQSR